MEPIPFHVFAINNEGLPLPVKSINLLSLVVVKAFIREVLLSAVQLVLNGLPNNLLGIEVIQEMVVGQSGVVKQVYEERRVSYETTSYEGVWERLDAHRVVVELKQ